MSAPHICISRLLPTSALHICFSCLLPMSVPHVCSPPLRLTSVSHLCVPRLRPTSASHVCVPRLRPTSASAVISVDLVWLDIAGRTVGDYFYILAAEDGTQVAVSGRDNFTLNAGQSRSLVISSMELVAIHSDKPILVAQVCTPQATSSLQCDIIINCGCNALGLFDLIPISHNMVLDLPKPAECERSRRPHHDHAACPGAVG